MAVIPELRAALAGLVAGVIPDAVPYSSTPDSIVTPAVIVGMGSPFAPSYSRRMGRNVTALYRFEVQVLTGRIDVQVAQDLLDEFASGDGPVVLALFEPDALGDDAAVIDVVGQSYGAARVGNTDYAGFSLTVDVEA